MSEINMTQVPHLSSDKAGWGIIKLIQADEEGCRYFLDHYKPFRLMALQQDPDAFGSNYAREIQFSDDDWLNRVKHPLAKTYVAAGSSDGKILSAVSLIGPLPTMEPEQRASQFIKTNDAECDNHSDATVEFEIAGVYTAAEVRGQGLGRILMQTAIKHAVEEARQLGKHLKVKAVVYASNTVAISFYEKCGYTAAGIRAGYKGSQPVTELDMLLSPSIISSYL